MKTAPFVACLHASTPPRLHASTPGMLILGLETATDTCSVALHDGECPRAELSLHRPRVHGERLPLLIREALAHAGVQAANLDAVAVSEGPGSYTGLRIGASTAKGLVEATGAALVSVPSLEAMAARIAPWTEPGDLSVPAFTSRRGEVFAAAYRSGKEHMLETVHEVSAVKLLEAAGWLGVSSSGRVWIGGPGAPALAEVLAANPSRSVREVEVAPSATSVASVGLRRLRAGKTTDPASFEPHYLKGFVPGG